MVRNVKGEPGTSKQNGGDDQVQDDSNELDRRVLRSRYLAVKNLISGNIMFNFLCLLILSHSIVINDVVFVCRQKR